MSATPAVPTSSPRASRPAARRGAPAAPAPGVPPAPLDPQGQEAYDRLTAMVAIARADGACLLANSTLENAIRQSRRKLVHGRVLDWFTDPTALHSALDGVVHQHLGVHRFDATLRCQPPGAAELPVHVIVTPVGGGGPDALVVIEMFEIERQVQLDRERRLHELVQAHQELLRNLAHEVKNPLGGIRGAAQLLGLEQRTPEVTDYTDVIIREADRLQGLVDRLLAPHQRAPAWTNVNIHEVCERVRALVLAEFPRGLTVQRDYDTSLPELQGDRERLIQALLNIARNAAQALGGRIAAGDARIVLRTRVARQVTLRGQRFRLAIDLQVEDNGPGVPAELRERIFQPLVSGHAGGHGLGLMLAQAFVQQHGGTLECDSEPGRTRFTLRLPVSQAIEAASPERAP